MRGVQYVGDPAPEGYKIGDVVFAAAAPNSTFGLADGATVRDITNADPAQRKWIKPRTAGVADPNDAAAFPIEMVEGHDGALYWATSAGAIMRKANSASAATVARAAPAPFSGIEWFTYTGGRYFFAYTYSSTRYFYTATDPTGAWTLCSGLSSSYYWYRPVWCPQFGTWLIASNSNYRYYTAAGVAWAVCDDTTYGAGFGAATQPGSAFVTIGTTTYTFSGGSYANTVWRSLAGAPFTSKSTAGLGNQPYAQAPFWQNPYTGRCYFVGNGSSIVYSDDPWTSGMSVTGFNWTAVTHKQTTFGIVFCPNGLTIVVGYGSVVSVAFPDAPNTFVSTGVTFDASWNTGDYTFRIAHCDGYVYGASMYAATGMTRTPDCSTKAVLPAIPALLSGLDAYMRFK